MGKIKTLSKVVILLFVSSIIIVIPISVMAHGFDVRDYRDDNSPDKTGILVISLLPKDALTVTKQKNLEERIKDNFPSLTVYWSFFDIGGEASSAFITEGKQTSPKMMLNQMQEEGITHVAILPLSIIPGETYARLVWMVNTLQTMPTGFRKIILARPFFGVPEEINQTCQTVLSVLPEHSGKGEAVVLFFEEQSRLGDYIYPGLQYFFWQLDKRVFIGTAGTSLSVQDVARSLSELKAERISIVPFLPYQTKTLASWKKSLEDGGQRHIKIAKTAVVSKEAAMDVLIMRLKRALSELGFTER